MTDQNDFIYTDGGSTAHVLYRRHVDNNAYLVPGSEEGWQNPERNIVTEEIPARLYGVHRSVSYVPRLYVASFTFWGTTETDLLTWKTNWENWHNPELGPGVLTRCLANGNTRALACIPQKSEWEAPRGYSRVVKQAYLAASPWWYNPTVVTANGTFNNAVPVNVSCTNSGQIAAWPVITITGVINTPKIQNSSGYYIQIVKTTANADDTLVIDCRPGACWAKYYAHGAGSGVYCWRSSSSRWITLPLGTANLILSATSGTATCAISWYSYYGSLYS